MHPFRTLRSLMILGGLLVCGAGCSPPALSSRMVQDSSAWFVRLDSYQEAAQASAPYDHPAAWSAEDTAAVLGRLLLEDQGGLMDKPKPPRPVFSPEEIRALTPALQQALQSAGPREWIAFYLSQPDGSATAVTSGGLFLADSQLHVVLANHHRSLAPTSPDLAAVRANPFHALRGTRGRLTFESSRFVVDTQPNWSGGHTASASELILDHRAWLSLLRSAGGAAPVSHPSVTSPPPNQVAAAPTEPIAVTQEADQATTIRRLQEEVERLKHRVEEQESELARLRRNAERPSPAKTTP